MKAYAERVGADTKNWHFLTGEKQAIYDIAGKGYLLAAAEDAQVQGGFLHSPLIVLVDQEKHIRGFYDGTSVVSVDSLIEDIKVLYAEYYAKKSADKNKIEQKHE